MCIVLSSCARMPLFPLSRTVQFTMVAMAPLVAHRTPQKIILKKPQHTKHNNQCHAAVQHNTAVTGSLTFRTHTGAQIVQHVAKRGAPGRIQVRIDAHDTVVAEIATQKNRYPEYY